VWIVSPSPSKNRRYSFNEGAGRTTAFLNFSEDRRAFDQPDCQRLGRIAEAFLLDRPNLNAAQPMRRQQTTQNVNIIKSTGCFEKLWRIVREKSSNGLVRNDAP